jgi:hypothetical protein
MGLFLSYSSRDKDAVKNLTQDLQDADEQVWMDQRLAGGDAWWRAILEQIRGCDVFIFALSQNSINSKPCQAELSYAQALGLPILPVQVGMVDSMQLNPLAKVQAVDYRAQTTNTGMRLIAALNRARAQIQPLPDPLPPEPEVPFEYLIRLYTTISGTDYLSPPDQATVVAQLQFGLREDGDHDAARHDIISLLMKLRDRPDVTYQTRIDVEAILTSIGAESPPQPPIATETTAIESSIADAANLASETGVPTEHLTPASGPTIVDAAAGATQAPESAVPTEVAESGVAATQRRPSDQSCLDIESREAPQKPIAEPKPPTFAPDGDYTPPASPGRLVGAFLIDVIPILVIFGIGYGLAIAKPAKNCRYANSAPLQWTTCDVDVSLYNSIFCIGIAASLALMYGIWNWLHRRSNKGASIGQSVLKFKVVSAQTGQPRTLGAKRIVGLLIPLLALLAGGTWFLAHSTVQDAGHETCIDTRTWQTCSPPSP